MSAFDDDHWAAQATFLEGVWKIIPEEDPSWVHRVASRRSDNGPLGDYSAIVKEMLEAGISAEKIARFARIEGFEVAFQLLFYLDDPDNAVDADTDQSQDREYSWILYLVDPETDAPIKPLWGGYEALLSMDPTGREMRPKDA